MGLFWILNIDQDVVQIYYNKDIKLSRKNLVDVALKTSRYIGKAIMYYLVLEVAVFSAENRLLHVTFSDSHPMIGTIEFQVDKLFGSA